MNYKRIYDEFISDRKNKKIIGYSEKHHIIPKMLGGGDTKENIIILSPEDHLFCHLLLAKHYGGKHWFAVKMMLEVEPCTKTDRLITNGKKRYAFGSMRRNVSKFYSENYRGENSPSSDKNKYTLKHIDGSVAFGNRFELSIKTKLARVFISKLILGTRKSMHGWYNPEHVKDGVIGHEILIQNKVKDKNRFYVYDKNKKEYFVNRYELEQLMGSKKATSLLASHRTWSYGFTLDKNAISREDSIKQITLMASKSRCDISGINNPRSDKNVYRFYNYFTNEVFIGTRADMAQKYNLRSVDVIRILSNEYDHIKGWRTENNYRVMKQNTYNMGVKAYGRS